MCIRFMADVRIAIMVLVAIIDAVVALGSYRDDIFSKRSDRKKMVGIGNTLRDIAWPWISSITTDLCRHLRLDTVACSREWNFSKQG